MPAANDMVDVIRNAIITTEVETTRAIAELIRKLPANFPHSEFADALDATADQLNDMHATPAE